jgi:O-antigen/teichoic acid export membrane protein
VSLHAVVWLWFFNLLPTWSAVSRQPGLLEALVRRSLKATVFLAALLVATVVLCAPTLVRLLYGPGYDESALLLHPLIFVPALAWVSGNWRFALIARGALHDELVSSLFGAVLCVGGLLVAGSRLDPMLAATIFCAAEGLTLVVAWVMWRRNLRAAGGAASTAAR